MNNVFIIRYGHDYEHDTIFGVYSSRYLANKAKKALIETTDDCYDYYTVTSYLLDDKTVKELT